MKEKILAMLKTKYKDLGLSEKILERYAAKLAKTTKEEKDIETAVDGVEEDLQVFQSLQDTYRTEVANLKKELAKQAPKGAKEEKEKEPENPDPQKSESDTTNPELKALIEGMSNLTKIVTGMQAEKTVTSRKSVFESKLNELKGLPESDKALRLELMEAKNFETDEDFNSWMDDQVTKAGEIAKAAPSEEFEGMPAPIGSSGGSSKGESQAFLDNVAAGWNF